MTFKSGILTERQKAVVETIRMRLTEKLALAYMKEVGFDISDTTYYREKRKVEELKFKRLFYIASTEFYDQHMGRIDTIELALKLMWKNYNIEQNPFKRVIILEKIISIQPYLSAYYGATKMLAENNNFLKMKYDVYQNLLKEKEELKSNNNNNNTPDDHHRISSINKRIKAELDNMTIINSTEEEPDPEKERIKREAEERYKRYKYNFVV